MTRHMPLSICLPMLLAGCSRLTDHSAATAALCDPVLPVVMHGYSPEDAPLPSHFISSPAGTVVFSDNQAGRTPITNAGATLGRVLFHDTRLSADNRTSCASCHRQEFGFGDTVATGHITRDHLPRRTMALANARFNASGRFFWDERAPSLEAQVLVPIQDSLELGSELAALEQELSAQPYYARLFAAAFGSPEVTREGIASALAQFVRSLISSHSRFDAVFATGGAPDYSLLTPREQEGMELFNTVGCVNCHRTVTQFADQASNTGLDQAPRDTGAGSGRFKPASLRNIAVRPPYMHDGRFRTLEQVVEFYDHQVRDSPGLDPRLRAPDGPVRRLGLSHDQTMALVAFLETLTDSAFLKAEKFSDPFPCHRRN